jgi:DNA-directed RNA polymerase subunit RPC12/RpoP
MSDLIRREDAIEAINKSLDKETLLNRFVRKIAIDAIIQIPSADRPQGEWKKNKVYKHIIFCSECGEPFEQSNSAECWNYCPNCGARMFVKDMNVPNKEGASDDKTIL